ncbi:MAG TPA: RidA family protein [Gemmatimonadaceae bacterium]|nr:RidA family protein [Gemmatimonadaceae bacterium]
MRRLTMFALLLLPLAGCGLHRSNKGPRVEFVTWATPTDLPFSPAVRVGNLLFLSGQIGTGADGNLVAGGIAAETRQAMENIRGVLSRSGSSMDRVVKCLVMLADMQEWAAMNVVYTAYFPNAKPARSSFGANGLALGARVEIECIAVVP